MSYTFIFSTIGSYSDEDHLYNDLSNYPYQDTSTGNYSSYDSISQIKNKPRIDTEIGYIHESKTLNGLTATMKIRPFQYFYFQTDYRELIEKTSQNNDHLSLFTFNVNYDRLRFENIDLGWTIGSTYIGNEVHRWGFNLGLQSNYFFGKNWSASGEVKWGWLNNTNVNSTKLSLQYHLHRYYISGGYEHFRIGFPEYNFFKTGIGIYLP